MIVLKSGMSHDACEVIRMAGYVDITPTIGLATHKIFAKDGMFFVFNGWHRVDEKRLWQDVELIQVSIQPVVEDDAKAWKFHW